MWSYLIGCQFCSSLDSTDRKVYFYLYLFPVKEEVLMFLLLTFGSNSYSIYLCKYLTVYHKYSFSFKLNSIQMGWLSPYYIKKKVFSRYSRLVYREVDYKLLFCCATQCCTRTNKLPWCWTVWYYITGLQLRCIMMDLQCINMQASVFRCIF